MDKVLLVVNMQEFYVGRGRNKKLFDYKDVDKLIDSVNKRIAAYEAEEVFYIKTIGKGLFKGGMPKANTAEADLVTKMKVVSKNVYMKSKADAFTNDALGDFLRARNVKSVELVGVDGGVDVGATALSALDYVKEVMYNEACVESIDTEKDNKLREKLSKTKCKFISEV